MVLRTLCCLVLAVLAGAILGLRAGMHGPSLAPAIQRSAAAADASKPTLSGYLHTPAQSLGKIPAAWRKVGLHPLSSVDAAAVTLSNKAPVSADSVVAFHTGSRAVAFLSEPPPVVTQPGQPTETPTQTTTTGDASSAQTVPTGPPPEISDVHTISLTPFSATLAWTTNETTTGRVAYGLDGATLWTAADQPGGQHQAVLTGLEFSTTYRVMVTARAEDGRVGSAAYALTTPALSGPVHGSTSGDQILIDGQPSFLRMVWNQCPSGYAEDIAVGINLFAKNGCGEIHNQMRWLNGQAFSLADATEPWVGGTGLIGTFLTDEWDAFLPARTTIEELRRAFPPDAHSPKFLTLTNHFYSRANPPEDGRGIYPKLAEVADVVGFDLYTLQGWCRYDTMATAFDSQREIVELAHGKPTFQWIEARWMNCHGPELDPTPATVRAETWLAIAGGAHAIGFFPYDWEPQIGEEIARLSRDIKTLVPALVEPNAPVDVNGGSGVRVGVRVHNGAVYVIAVNGSRAPANATIRFPQLGNRSLVTLDGVHTATAQDGTFSDAFAPLEVHIWVAAPAA